MKALAWIAALLLGAGAAAVAAATPSVAIELRPQVHAVGAQVLLGQVARLESTDLALMRRLVDLPVVRSPSVGESSVLDREALAAWLARRLGLAPEQVEWRGPSSMRVVSSARIVSGEQLAATALQALRSWLAARKVPADAELVSAVRDIEVPEGALQLRARDPGHAQARRRITLWVEAWVDGRFVRVVPLSFALPEAVGSILVRDEHVQAEAALPASTQKMRATADTAPIVTRGEWASLQSGVGIVRTEARVQVLQDGRLGDNVRVRAPTGAASLIARVTGTGQVEVAR